MKNTIKGTYIALWYFFRTELIKTFTVITIIFSTFFLGTSLLVLNNITPAEAYEISEIAKGIIEDYQNFTSGKESKIFKGSIKEEISEQKIKEKAKEVSKTKTEEIKEKKQKANIETNEKIDSFEMKWHELALHNISAAFIGVISGAFPFLFMPILLVIMNAIVSSTISSFISLCSGIPFLKLIMGGLALHGIIEIPAFLLATTIGFRFSIYMTKSALKKIKDEKVTEFLKLGLALFSLIVIPMLILAGIIEAFFTPVVLDIVARMY